ncbi:MAG TPA: phosphoenolpyruvate hydrolase family protein [Gemmatimonadales bacterium]
MPFIPYQECLTRLRAQRAAGSPIIGAGAGTGISAKFAEQGGVDLIIIYNSGRYRMAGRGSAAGMMPYGDANAIVVDMAREVLPVVTHTPVLAGVCGTDPFRLMRVFLPQLQEMGFDGVQNFPTVGLIDGQFRRILEETGMSIQLEVDMITAAHELGMLTCPYVFDEATATRFTEAGADVVVAHVNTTVAGSVGVKSAAMPLDEAVTRVQAMHDAAAKVNPEVVVLCHGGPIARPEDVQYVFERTRGIAGFFGASSIERLATEPAIEEQARRFKSLKLRT